MANPTPGDVHVNGPLTNVSIAFIQNEENFIASRVFPNVPVAKQSDLYFTYNQSDFWRNEVELRAPGAETAGSGHRLTTDSYRCDVYAIHRDIDDQVRANADAPINLDREATIWLTQQLLLNKETDFVTNYFATSIWTGGTGGGDITGVAAAPGANEVLQWNDANSTPIEDIREQIVEVAENTGRRPNTLSIGPRVWAALMDHPDILDRIKFTQKGVVTMDLFASLLDLDNVRVGWASRDTAAEGATDVLSFFWGSAALLTYAPPSASLMEPSAGYTFSWTGLLGSGAMGGRIRQFRLERNQSDRTEAEMAYDMAVVGAGLGVFFATVVA
jgi:hypothetical protein